MAGLMALSMAVQKVVLTAFRMAGSLAGLMAVLTGVQKVVVTVARWAGRRVDLTAEMLVRPTYFIAKTIKF